jgi:hypothetical protein
MMSNNEMLEEALKRETPCSAKDVGWRRWSAREAQNMQRVSEEEHRRSLDYGPLNESGAPSHPANAPSVVVNGIEPSPTTSSPATSSATSQNNQEGRFFRFRFTSGMLICSRIIHSSSASWYRIKVACCSSYSKTPFSSNITFLADSCRKHERERTSGASRAAWTGTSCAYISNCRKGRYRSWVRVLIASTLWGGIVSTRHK